MKKHYIQPGAAMLAFSAEEIRTDLIAASNGTGISHTWDEFLKGEDAVV